MKETPETSLVIGATPEFIARRILLVRGQKVMLDSELAELYQVPTMRLNEQVKRNIERSPVDFMFQLAKTGSDSLTSQIAISKKGRGGRRHAPYVFTGLGIAMLSSVLNSDRAVQMNIFIMRAFVALRQAASGNRELANRMNKLEPEQIKQGKDVDFVYTHIKRLIDVPLPPKDKLGF